MRMRRFINQILILIFVAFIITGVAFSMVLLIYLCLFSLLIGTVLFAIAWVRHKFFAQKLPIIKKKGGRIIHSDDWKEL